MFNFEDLLTDAQKQQLANEEAEIARIYALPDRFLAAQLLRMVRACRRNGPERLSNPLECVYEPSFVWQFVPELAKRLGATDLELNEATRYNDRSDAELRFLAGVYLRNITAGNLGVDHDADTTTPDVAELLTRDPARGNPIAIAIDRICPPEQRDRSKDDFIVLRISRRDGVRESWQPEAA